LTAKKIEHEVLNCQIVVENCGSKDIRGSSFEGPISIKFPNEAKLISTNISDNTDIDASISSDEGSIFLKWRLLKRKEYIKINALLEVDTKTTPPEEIEKKVSTSIRLVDVVDNSNKTRYTPAIFIASMSILFFSMLLIVPFVSDVNFKPEYGIEVDGSTQPLYISHEGLHVCEQRQTSLSIRNCVKAPEANTYTLSILPGPQPIGFPIGYLVSALAISIIYPLLLYFAINRIRKRKSSIARVLFNFVRTH